MVKLDPIQSMMKLAETIADIIVIPDHCTLDRDDIYQEVCLIYLERGVYENSWYSERSYYQKHQQLCESVWL